MKIKICGITNLADARYCAAAGADYLGFVLAPQSPRHVTDAQAGAIIEWLYGPAPVGVFVDAGADEVNRAADRAAFDLVQLHGDESPETCAAIERPVIKAIGITPETTPAALTAQVARYRDVAQYVLFDSRLGGTRGGTGVPFEWQIATGAEHNLPVFLAGGLRPENVEAAARSVEPFAVDVSSGVESAPGEKDYDRVEAFMKAMLPFRAGQD